jgi:hypothetical protein
MKRKSHGTVIWWASILAIAAIPVAATIATTDARAQSSWSWPWETETRREPPPRQEPQPPGQYDPRRQPPPYGAPAPGYGQQPPVYGQQPPAYQQNRSPICLQLEQQLARQANGGQNRAQLIAGLSRQIREYRSQLRNAEIRIDRRNCYERFLFTRTLRRTPECINLARSASALERQLRDLELQYQQAQSHTSQDRQDEIIRALARNNCGTTYTREARRRSPMRNFWQDEDTSDGRVRGNTFAGLPFATYRTLCVRLCDGYYFPVSFSTLPTHFARDAQACQSRCAAPTELYFHQNPGGSVAEMISQTNQQPYSQLKSAFRYRKEYVPGCSCKQAEYVDRSAPGFQGNGGRPQGAAAQPGQTPGKKPKRDAMSPVR